MPDAAPEADVVGNLDAALLERLWAIFDVALEVVQRPEEPCGEPSAEQWSRLHLALAAVPECQRDKPLLSAAEIERLRAEVAELREIREVAGAALRCALSPDSDRIAREGFTEIALAYLAGYGGDWNAMQAAEKGRARGH